MACLLKSSGHVSPVLWLSCLLFTLLTDSPPSVFARTWIVDAGGAGDFVEIQAGITAADAGDSVLVAPGTYLENIRFAGRDIVLMSTAGPEQTTIDGSSKPRSVIECRMGESNDCVIRGFTITGGSGSGTFPGERNGGGIWMQDAEPSIIDNIIQGNAATAGTFAGSGGGIYCRAGIPDDGMPLRKPRIIGNQIRFNTAKSNGGGIALNEKVSAIIRRNEVAYNTTMNGDGAGIWILVRHANLVELDGNSITGNVATDHGGGVYAGNLFHGSIPPLQILLTHNEISRNVARGRSMLGDSGGGVWMDCTDAHIISNTIVANEGRGGSNSYGGGIVLRDMGQPTVERNIIALTIQGGGILCHDGVTPLVRNNLFWSNDGGDARGTCASVALAEGNIGTDPLFCGAHLEDYSLPPNSPAFLHPSGVLGAIAESGCTVGVLVIPSTWSNVKVRFASSR
jgi:hypothetical protein